MVSTSAVTEFPLILHCSLKTACPIIDAMDTKQFIMYRLYRDSTNYKNGHHVKVFFMLRSEIV